jgi:sugar phosphate isomerase/epimerase
MRCRFAASTGCCVDRPVPEVLSDLHAAQVTAVEIGTPPRHFDPWRYDEVQTLRGRLQQLSIDPVSIHAPFGGLLDLTDPNPHHRHAAIGAVLSAASALREVGGSRVVVHVSDVPRSGQDIQHRLHDGGEALGVLARACKHMDMLLIVETPLPHLIGGHPDEFAAVVGALDRSVGVCFDTSHTTLGGHWDRFMTVAGERLVHVHANDHRGQYDDHLPPGEGTIDWTHVRQTLETVRFDGWIVLELACPSGPLASYFQAAMLRARALFPCP